MTDKAFSDLTSASALNDADIFAITQSGTSKKIASSVVKTYMQEGFTPTSTTTLTNKTVNLTNNTLTGTIAQFNSALSDADFCTIAGSETITNKTLTTPILSATVSGTTSGRLGYLSGALSYGDGTNQQTVATLDRTQTFTAAQSFSGNVTLGDASGDTVTLNSGTVTLNNSTTISAASTKTLTLNGGAGSNGLVIDASNNVGIGIAPSTASGYTTLDLSNATNGARIRCLVGSTAYGGMYTNGTTDFRIGSLAAVPLNIITGSNTIATFDTSGNLGLSVTPSAWGSGIKAFDISGGALVAVANTTEVHSNSYYNGTNSIYKATGFATKYTLNAGAGAHYWYTAPSGTAGNAISFTQAMTLDASGNLLVGTTSTIAATNQTKSIQTSCGSPTNRVTNGLVQQSYGSSAGLPFVVLNTVGSFLGFGVDSSAADNTFRFATVAYDGNGMYWGTTYCPIKGGAYTNASDYRIKENVSLYEDGALEKVLALRPVKFNVIPERENKNQVVKNEVGFIAHELQEYIPEVVYGEKDAVEEDGRPKHQAVDYAKLTAVLVKAIQELHQEIETLKQKVNA